MKKFSIIVILAVISMTFLPFAAIKHPTSSTDETSQTTQNTTTTQQPQVGDTISVFRTIENKTESITLFEYVCGSVAAEMPLAYDEEAIKAQAVACYTNALRLKTTENASADSHISDDSTVHQGYIDESQRKEKWGNDFNKYETKLRNAVKAVENHALYYNNELCVAAFYAISCGKTEDAKNIWGNDVPYLKSVPSEGDKLSPQYASTLSFPKDDFIKTARELGIQTKDISTLENAITITETSPSGTVLSAKLGDKTFTGEQIRKAFSLRSPVFTIKTTADTVTFSVNGYGHGVGMSQYGADYMAKQGSTYDEILKHYYTDIEIRKVS